MRSLSCTELASCTTFKASETTVRVCSTSRPWRLGATSFVYPGSWAFNVQRLGLDFQDIEILFFEDGPSCFPSAAECEKLAQLKKAHDLRYCLHTPLCASLASSDPARRHAGIESVLRSMKAAAPFAPENTVLHVYLGDQEHDPLAPKDLDAWRTRAWESLKTLRNHVENPQSLCVESIDYDIELLSPVLDDLKLSYALDIGHWVRDGRDTLGLLERLLPSTRLLQWHGTDPDDRDHRSLEHYPDALGVAVLQLLRKHCFSGTVTLEVFRPEDLTQSLDKLRQWERRLP